jgi:nitrogen fixation-related uncharacterized protein
MKNPFKKKKKAFKRKATEAETILIWVAALVVVFYALYYWWGYMKGYYEEAVEHNQMVNTAYSSLSEQHQEVVNKENEILAEFPDLKSYKQQLDQNA